MLSPQESQLPATQPATQPATPAAMAPATPPSTEPATPAAMAPAHRLTSQESQQPATAPAQQPATLPADCPFDVAAMMRRLAQASPAAADFFIPQGHCRIPSTNTLVKAAIKQGAPEGLTAIALTQEGGYGRQGRPWSSPLGGLYLSILLRPAAHGAVPGQLASFALCAALAVRRALADLGFVHDILVKWPNDVLCAQGKLAGISAEAVGGALCLGLGINLFPPSEEHLVGGKYRAAYAAPHLPMEASGDFSETQAAYREDTTIRLLSEVHSVYNQWLGTGFSSLRDEYRGCAFLTGRHVHIESLTEDILYEGVVRDVDIEGCLCLVDAAGKLVRVHSGEVHLKEQDTGISGKGSTQACQQQQI
ncbi:MAG: biotin--[acetyl-CoA-carboxylase] ligase [Coriobacteriaceae bacterium]|jgi:BirA family biotin operon repressor/biotin-[acetyl-CoA-carboxylase] ligase|nr:biotin--[acetyl-CoA-carboxylase] ligase [Coriobacteriaceae bacterium]